MNNLISYRNVMNNFDHNYNTMLICISRVQANYIFQNALDLWYIKGFTDVKPTNKQIIYGHVSIYVKTLELISRNQHLCFSFRGLFLFHPELEYIPYDSSEGETLRRMASENERFLSKCQP